MRILDSIRFRIVAFFDRSQTHSELEEELRSHIAHRADDLARSGLSRREAERRARLIDHSALPPNKLMTCWPGCRRCIASPCSKN